MMAKPRPEKEADVRCAHRLNLSTDVTEAAAGQCNSVDLHNLINLFGDGAQITILNAAVDVQRAPNVVVRHDFHLSRAADIRDVCNNFRALGGN